MTTQLQERQLKKIVQESFKELWEAEMMKLRAFLIPYISDNEQRKIERRYGKPVREAAKTFKIKI